MQLCSEVGNFNSLQSISVAVSVKLDPRAEQNQRSPASLALQFLPEGYREALAGRTVKILTQQTFVSTAVTAQGVKALRFQRQQTFVSTAVTAQGVKALTFQRPTFKKGQKG